MVDFHWNEKGKHPFTARNDWCDEENTMWDFFGSPQLANLLSLVSLAVACAKPPQSSTKTASPRRMVWSRRRTVFGVIALVLYGYGFYRTHQLEKELQIARTKPLIISIGNNGNRIFTEVNMQALKLRDKERRFHALVIVRVVDRSINENTDRTIAKSYLVDTQREIPGNQIIEVPVDQNFLSRLPLTSGLVDVRLFLLPKSVGLDQTSCLADVNSNHGRLLAGGFYTMPYTMLPHADEDAVPHAH
jgi:hypothetical protein